MKRRDTGTNIRVGTHENTEAGARSALNSPNPGSPAGGSRGRDAAEVLWEQLTGIPRVDSETQAVDRIQALTRIVNTSSALLAEATEDFRQLRQERETAQGVPSRDQANGLKEEIGLARGESPYMATKHAGLAYALTHELPRTMELLREGKISEYKASIIEAETHDLTGSDKARIDAAIANEAPELGPRSLTVRVRHMSETTDPHAAVTKHERCVTERRVTVRPAPGGMAYLTALLPQKQAIAIYANLHTTATTSNTGKNPGATTSAPRAGETDTTTNTASTGTDSAGNPGAVTGVGSTAGGEGVKPRSRQQIMADTLVERLTGQETADAVPVEIGVLVPLDALSDDPALIPGHGTTPTHTITGTNTGGNTGGRASGAPVFVRRVFTHPISGKLVGMESTRRNYPELLRQLITYREGGICRTPGCDALIQHIDHATPVREGGQTTWDNASGLCARCNYVKENPG